MADIIFTTTTFTFVDLTWEFTGETISYVTSDGDSGSLSSGVGVLIEEVNAGVTITFSTDGDWSGVTKVYMGLNDITGDLCQFSDFTSLTLLDLSDTEISASSGCLDNLTSMVQCSLDGCDLTEQEVDFCLESLKVNEASGLPTRDCIVNLGGDNSAPSNTGLKVAFELIYLAEWTLTVNSIGSTIEIETQSEIEAINTDSNTLRWSYYQTTDVVATGSWTPVGNQASRFLGKYNGNFKKVTGLLINNGSLNYAGMFGYIFTASIENLGVEGSITANDTTGILAGYADSSTINRCYTKGDVTGNISCGGFVGISDDSQITDCYSWPTGSGIYGLVEIGGFMGGALSATTTNCYSNGPVSGDIDAGGFAGYSDVSTYVSCFWDIDTSSTSNNEGTAVGKTTEEMQTLSTFTDVGWDFVDETTNGTDDYWIMVDYPELYGFISNIEAISTISTISVGASQIAIAYPEGYSEFSTPNTLYCSYADPLDEIAQQSYEETMNWQGIPVSVSKFYNADLEISSADYSGYYFAIDIIKNTETLTKTSDTTDPGVAEYTTWNGNKLQISTDGIKYYLNVINIIETAQPTNRLVFQATAQATGINDELILNDSTYTMNDIESDPNTGEVDIKSISLGGVPISVGRIGYKYYLIVNEVLEP